MISKLYLKFLKRYNLNIPKKLFKFDVLTALRMIFLCRDSTFIIQKASILFVLTKIQLNLKRDFLRKTSKILFLN